MRETVKEVFLFGVILPKKSRFGTNHWDEGGGVYCNKSQDDCLLLQPIIINEVFGLLLFVKQSPCGLSLLSAIKTGQSRNQYCAR